MLDIDQRESLTNKTLLAVLIQVPLVISLLFHPFAILESVAKIFYFVPFKCVELIWPRWLKDAFWGPVLAVLLVQTSLLVCFLFLIDFVRDRLRRDGNL